MIWGTHVLILKAGEDSGTSIWRGDEGPGWRREKLIGDRRRITTTKVQRSQAEFRKMLLGTDGRRCAVTGETCEEVLEAAHIVGVANGGQEVLPNGILLRADLHRLYDAGKFDICPETGSVLAHQVYESFDLESTRIPDEILGRIRDALNARSQQASS